MINIYCTAPPMLVEIKCGELWSTNKKVIGANGDTPKWTFSGDYISALVIRLFGPKSRFFCIPLVFTPPVTDALRMSVFRYFATISVSATSWPRANGSLTTSRKEVWLFGRGTIDEEYTQHSATLVLSYTYRETRIDVSQF